MNQNLKTTLKTWPAVAALTIGLCFLTQRTAALLGFELPDQQNVEVVRQWLTHAFDSAKNLATCAILLAQVLILLPAAEEAIFRLPTRWLRGRVWWALSSALFSAAHYLAQPFPDSAFIALFFFGVAQCRLYRKTGRLWCAILNHCLFNLTNVALLLLLPA